MVEFVEGFSEVVVIGNMLFVVRVFCEKGVKIFVFEWNLKFWDREMFSDVLEYIFFFEVEVVIVSGLVLVNGMFEMIFDWVKKVELVILIGLIV